MGEVPIKGQHWLKTQLQGLNAWQRRIELINKLGNKCVKCGSQSRLELDHINGRDWKPSEFNRWARVARYEKEAAQGLLQVLCRHCNAEKQ